MKNFFKGFVYAAVGIKKCVMSERNFRVHIVAAVTVFIFAYIYGVTRTQAAVLVLTVAAVLSLEAINTAIEAAVDLASDKHTGLGGLAKDAAAGAVLIAAAAALVVAVFVFGDKEKLFNTLNTFLSIWYLDVIYIAAGAVFVFGIKDKTKGK